MPRANTSQLGKIRLGTAQLGITQPNSLAVFGDETSQLGLIQAGTAQLGFVEPNAATGGISGTAALIAAAATLSASGTIVNAYSGTSAVTAAAATMAATGTVVNPSGFGSNFQLLGIG